MKIPAEVEKYVMWRFGANPRFGFPGITQVDPEKVVFFLKNEMSRVGGWVEALKIRPITDDYNPWRKCHTENYWVWFNTEGMPR